MAAMSQCTSRQVQMNIADTGVGCVNSRVNTGLSAGVDTGLTEVNTGSGNVGSQRKSRSSELSDTTPTQSLTPTTPTRTPLASNLMNANRSSIQMSVHPHPQGLLQQHPQQPQPVQMQQPPPAPVNGGSRNFLSAALARVSKAAAGGGRGTTAGRTRAAGWREASQSYSASSGRGESSVSSGRCHCWREKLPDHVLDPEQSHMYMVVLLHPRAAPPPAPPAQSRQHHNEDANCFNCFADVPDVGIQMSMAMDMALEEDACGDAGGGDRDPVDAVEGRASPEQSPFRFLWQAQICSGRVFDLEEFEQIGFLNRLAQIFQMSPPLPEEAIRIAIETMKLDLTQYSFYSWFSVNFYSLKH